MKDEHTVGTGFVVGTDGSVHAEIAVGWAARAAELAGRPLDILTAHPSRSGTGRSAALLHRAERRTAENLHDVLHRAEQIVHDAAPGLAVRSHVVDGESHEVLAGLTAPDRDVVIGSRGLGAVATRLLGGTADIVVARAAGPVSVIASGEAAEAVGRIVVATDRTEASEAAVEYAFRLAQTRRLPLAVVNAWDADTSSHSATYGPGPAVRRHEPSTAQADLVASTLALREAHPEVDTVHRTVFGPSAGEVLADEALHAGHLVVGSRGRTTLQGMLAGSTSRAVARLPHCPVTVVPGR